LFILPVFALVTLEKEENRLRPLIAALVLFLLESVVIFGGSFPLSWADLSALIS
jgi:hypothetical protein